MPSRSTRSLGFKPNMDALRSIDLTLAAIAGMLDETAGEIRDAGLEPTSDHLHRIGRALAEVFEIRQAIFAVRPDLEPNWSKAERPPSPDNRLLTRAMVDAIEFERNGDYSGAIELFERFLEGAASPLHIDIAKNEIQRLRRRLET